MSEREPEEKELHEFDFHDSRDGSYVDDNAFSTDVAGGSNVDLVKLLAIDHEIKSQSSQSEYELSTVKFPRPFGSKLPF